MKYYLLIVILVIFLAFTDAEDKGKFNSKSIEKMKNHMRKIRGLLRNLDTSDDDDDDDSNDDEGSSSDDDNPIVPGNATTTVPTTPKTTGRRFARVQFVDINNLSNSRLELCLLFFWLLQI